VFSTAEVEARAPLINHLKDYFPGIDENTPTRELIHKTQLIGSGSDPLLARAIRRCEDVEQNARMAPPTDDTASRNDACFAGHLIAEMNGDRGLIGSVMAQFVAEFGNELRDEFETKIKQQQDRIATLEEKLSFEARFREMEMRNIERGERRNEAKRGPTGRQGERGARGERGPAGARGPAGRPATEKPIIGWKVDAEHYRVVPFQSDGRPGPQAIELRPMFEKFLDEIDLSGNIREEVNAALRSLKPF
jgi:hypothetical protein